MSTLNIRALHAQGKKFQTRCCKPVRIISTDINNPEYPIVAAIDNGISEDIESYTNEGKYYFGIETDSYDLEVVNEKKTYYMNVYKYASVFKRTPYKGVTNMHPGNTIFESENEAIASKDTNLGYIGTFPINIEEVTLLGADGSVDSGQHGCFRMKEDPYKALKDVLQFWH